MHGFRHHRVSTLVMAGTPIGVIKKWIGHGSDEMVNRYTHLRPDFMQSELERVPDFITRIIPQIGTKNAELAPVDPHGNVAA
jgi:integrase